MQAPVLQLPWPLHVLPAQKSQAAMLQSCVVGGLGAPLQASSLGAGAPEASTHVTGRL